MSKWGTIWAHNKLNIINRSHHSSVAVGAWVERSIFMALQTEAGLTHDRRRLKTGCVNVSLYHIICAEMHVLNEHCASIHES